jgi:hypothetical protein
MDVNVMNFISFECSFMIYNELVPNFNLVSVHSQLMFNWALIHFQLTFNSLLVKSHL